MTTTSAVNTTRNGIGDPSVAADSVTPVGILCRSCPPIVKSCRGWRIPEAGRSMKELRTTFAALGLAICALAYAHAQQVGTADLLRGLAEPSRWLIHSGDYTSRRHSPLTGITPENVMHLAPVWLFETGLGFGRNAKFEATPIAIDGTLYVTGLLNHAWAIDGRTGKEIWRYERKLPPATRVCCGMVNRGFAVFADRLFMTTLDAHVMALDRKTGTPIWDVPMADYRLGYSSTVAPLVVKDKLIVGMAGGELA